MSAETCNQQATAASQCILSEDAHAAAHASRRVCITEPMPAPAHRGPRNRQAAARRRYRHPRASHERPRGNSARSSPAHRVRNTQPSPSHARTHAQTHARTQARAHKQTPTPTHALAHVPCATPTVRRLRDRKGLGLPQCPMRRVGRAWYLMRHSIPCRMVFRHGFPCRARAPAMAPRRSPPARHPSDRSYAPRLPGAPATKSPSSPRGCTPARTHCWRSAAAPPPCCGAFRLGVRRVRSGRLRSVGSARATAHGRQCASSTARARSCRPPARAPKQRCMSYATCASYAVRRAHRLRAGGLALRVKHRPSHACLPGAASRTV